MKSYHAFFPTFSTPRIQGLSKKLVQCACLLLTIFCILPFVWADQTLFVSKVTTAPQVDGSDWDPVWQQTRGIVTHDKVAGIDVTIKAVHTENQIFFLVQFPDPDESRVHKPWVWNSNHEMYDMGPQREDCFVMKWATDENTSDISIYAEEPYTADLWFWKANRTDPAGYSDDKWQKLLALQEPKTMPVQSRNGAKMFLLRKGDDGNAAYKSVIQTEKIGQTLGQFSVKKPTGSRADIQAKGSWKNGTWTIEFVRALKTGHNDDVQFDITKTYLFGISRYEIAGKKPNPKLTQPLYGSGDISEKLKLAFVKE